LLFRDRYGSVSVPLVLALRWHAPTVFLHPFTFPPIPTFLP
jgi:hypothetical protein